MVWVQRELKNYQGFNALPWPGTPSSRLGCSKLHPTQPWTLSEMEQSEVLWKSVPVPNNKSCNYQQIPPEKAKTLRLDIGPWSLLSTESKLGECFLTFLFATEIIVICVKKSSITTFKRFPKLPPLFIVQTSRYWLV